MNHTVIELCQFGLIPTVGGTYEITGDALESVDIVATAIWALVHYFLGIFISAIHATVACVVYRTITDIELIHHSAFPLAAVGWSAAACGYCTRCNIASNYNTCR